MAGGPPFLYFPALLQSSVVENFASLSDPALNG